MGKFKELVRKAWKPLKWPTYVFLAYHLAGEARFLYKYSTYSDERITKFEKSSGIEIYAPKENISNNALMEYLKIIKETNTTPNELEEIIIEDKKYFSKSLMGKIIAWGDKNGHANPVTKVLTMNSELDAPSAFHEIAHMKTFSNKEKEKLIEEWKCAALDSSGNSMYMNFPNMILSYCGIENSIGTPKLDSLGFVSSYATTNAYEDIAEFVEKQYQNIYSNYTVNFKQLTNPVYEKKFDLAIKYGLLPAESKEGYEIKKLYKEWVDLRHYSVKKKEFLDRSEEFLKKYPQSPFYINIILDRAMAVSDNSNTISARWDAKSEKELQRGLSVPSNLGYKILLEKLQELYAQLYSNKQHHDTNPYTEAIREYNKRIENFDTNLLNIGVNDVLEKSGVLKK